MTIKRYVIGVDIGGSHILSAAVDIDTGKILDTTRFEQHVDNKASKETILNTWAQSINQTISKLDKDKVAGIGFAMPGPFNYKKGIALYSGTNDKYEALFNADIRNCLLPYLDHSSLDLRFLNDATSFAVGADWFGKAKDANRSIALTLGTGFGSALIDDAKPVTDRSDVPQHGCFWHLPFLKGTADDYFSTRWFVNSFKEKAGIDVPGVKEIAVRAGKGEPVAVGLFEEFGSNMAQFMLPWLNKFKPEVVVFGGNISGAYDLFAPAIKNTLGTNKLNVRLEVSELMEDAALIGSARLFDDAFWQVIKDDLPEL